MDFEVPHRRLNILTGEWILVSPHRARRPWLGQVEKISPEILPAYDPECYLCPGNHRAGGVRNPDYASTFVFDNDYAALLPQNAADNSGTTESALFRAETETGRCRVVCFSPRHDLTLPELPQSQVEAVVRTWMDQSAELGSYSDISYVQIFENKGAAMGASNPHPHSQIWASSHLPNEPQKETANQADYLDRRRSCLLCDYLEAELISGERIVTTNDAFVALVPFWAIWPFEVIVVARRHFAGIADLSGREISGLADLLRKITARYDNLFEISFPYSMGFHQAPSKGGPYPAWHFHAHFYPPLLRSATVRKFMVGYELMAGPQRDITPETAADRLRGLSETHYRAR